MEPEAQVSLSGALVGVRGGRLLEGPLWLGGGQLSSFRRAKAPSWLLAVSLPIRGQDLPSMCVVQCFEPPWLQV